MMLLYEMHQKRPELLKNHEVYIDGGVRRGTDVLKALCLGARGVGLGRPFLYAQSVRLSLPSSDQFVDHLIAM